MDEKHEVQHRGFRLSPPAIVVSVFFFLASAYYAIGHIIDRMTCELQYSFTRDNPIYWAVGRGYLNGLQPYADLFEAKPPGVFLLSAISFAVCGEILQTV